MSLTSLRAPSYMSLCVAVCGCVWLCVCVCVAVCVCGCVFFCFLLTSACGCHQEHLRDAVHSTVLSFSRAKPKKRVVIMDEVDGMSSGDRGGVSELLKIIKTTETPIICICNDRQKQSIQSLAKSCFDLKFMRPSVPQIAERMLQIAQVEGLGVDREAMNALVVSTGGDVRQIFNALQMWKVGAANARADDVRKRMGQMNKDAILRVTGAEALSRLFSGVRTPLQQRYEMFFTDYDRMPLFVQVPTNTRCSVHGCVCACGCVWPCVCLCVYLWLCLWLPQCPTRRCLTLAHHRMCCWCAAKLPQSHRMCPQGAACRSDGAPVARS